MMHFNDEYHKNNLEEIVAAVNKRVPDYQPPEEYTDYYNRYLGYGESIARVWGTVLDRCNFPLISEPPYLDLSVPTASFCFANNNVKVNPEFIDYVIDLGISLDDAMTGLLMHEVGHYVDHPREMYRIIVQAEAVDRLFKDEPRRIQHHILNFFSDVYVNLRNMGKEKSGKELRDLYQLIAAKDDQCSLVFKLFDAFYGSMLDSYNASFKPDPELQKKVKELGKVVYFDEENESMYIKYFGEIILDLLKSHQPPPPYPPPPGRWRPGRGGDEPGDGKVIIYRRINPLDDADADLIDKMSDKEIEDALNEIAKRKGLKEYQRIKDFLDKKTGKAHDRITRNKSDFDKPIAGLESAEITWHNEYIDFYKRKAFGKIYIQRKPMVVNASNSYPNGLTKYKVEDPFPLINLWSSPWILPGITQRNVLEPGVISDKKFEFPHLWLSIDSSGSMPHPSSMSNAILAGYILALNYHRNKRMIGVHNFSCDSAMLLPTRDIDDVFKMLTAYFGGGTVFDPKKMKDYFKMLAMKGDLERLGIKAVNISNEKDYEKLIQRLDPAEREKLKTKELNVRLKQKVKEYYEKVDHVLLTDGGIFNLDEVIEYFNQTGEYTRHAIVVINNSSFAKEAEAVGKKLGFNEQRYRVFDVDKSEDILKIAIGQAKSISRVDSDDKA